MLKALEMARPGDLVAIFGEQLSQVWDLIVSFKPVKKQEPARKKAAARDADLVEV